MSIRPIFSTPTALVVSLVSVLALTACSTSGTVDPAAARAQSAVASSAPIATQAAPPSAVIPAIADLPSPTRQLGVTCDAFAREPKGSAEVRLQAGDVMAITLCSNASTGFSWAAPAIIGSAVSVTGSPTGMPAAAASSAGVAGAPLAAAPGASASAAETNSTSAGAPSPANAVGAPTAITFLVKADRAGTATVSLSYSRPWAGGEKDVWTYTVRVTVD